MLPSMLLSSIDKGFDIAQNALMNASLAEVLIVVAVVWTFVVVRLYRV
jgi:hypothetical protein